METYNFLPPFLFAAAVSMMVLGIFTKEKINADKVIGSGIIFALLLIATTIIAKG